MTWLCVTPERQVKTRRIMTALRGSLDGKICHGRPPKWPAPFVVWGHLWTGAKLVPGAMEKGVPFRFVDNGYHLPARGQATGYYALTWGSLWPMLLDDPDLTRLPVKMKPWRQPSKNPAGTILVCLPGPGVGKMFGWNMGIWAEQVVAEIRKHSDREIVIRGKNAPTPLAADMERAAVMVAHSSKAAVEAVLAGLPAIVEPMSPAAPVCGTDLSLIETPPMPSRRAWWASLMCQQFTLDELRSGAAREWLAIAERQGERNIAPGIPPMSQLVSL